jgi:hypothetical protein
MARQGLRIFPQAFGGNTWSRDEPDDVMFMGEHREVAGREVCYDTARVRQRPELGLVLLAPLRLRPRQHRARRLPPARAGQRKERPLDCKTPVSALAVQRASDNPGHVMGTQQARDVWLKLAGCSLDRRHPDLAVPCVAYPGCREGYAVHYCQHPGGHPFPGLRHHGIYNFLFGGGGKI